MITTASHDAQDRTRPRNIWRWVGIGAVLVAVSVGWIAFPVQDWLNDFNAWVEGLGALGYLLFGLLYIAGTVALAPGAALTIAGGLAFGLWSFPLVVVAATIGATLAFLIARHLARSRVERAIERYPTFKATEHAVNEEGWKIVALMRLSPVVPFNLQNYAFGVTAIPLLHYVAATFVGIMPGALLYTYLGAAGRAAGGDTSGGSLKWIFFAVGLILTIAVTVWVTIRAKATLDRHGVAEGQASTAEAGTSS